MNLLFTALHNHLLTKILTLRNTLMFCSSSTLKCAHTKTSMQNGKRWYLGGHGCEMLQAAVMWTLHTHRQGWLFPFCFQLSYANWLPAVASYYARAH